MNYANIKLADIANGSGVRISLFVSGCRHHCPGCFNQEAQDFNYGKEFTKETEKLILRELGKSHITGLTILGGEPMEMENQLGLYPFIKYVKRLYPEKSIWVYSGFTWEELIGNSRAHLGITEDFLKTIDVLVDGPFIEAEKDISLQFRGSRNQRILNTKVSIATRTPTVLTNEDINRK